MSSETSMRVTFWGARGSIPTPLTPLEVERKAISLAEQVVRAGITDPDQVETYLMENNTLLERGTVGGNTTCVSVEWDDTTIIFDAGTGIRVLGNKLMKGPLGKGGEEAFLLMTHTHWDHIMGFPFFGPLFKDNTIHIHGGHPDLEKRFRGQQAAEYYPISLDVFPASLKFHHCEENKWYDLPNGGQFKTILLNHPGGCYGYRVRRNGKSVVFATDAEYKRYDDEAIDKARNFFQDSDLLIFDSQYTLEESLLKEDWGHSTAVMGVKLAVQANVKKLALFHHEPNYSDDFINTILHKAVEDKEKYYPDAPLELIVAVEGLTVVL